MHQTRRDAYVTKLKKELDGLNASLDELESKARAAKDDARARYEEGLGKLRAEAKAANAKLDQVKAAGEESWDSLMAEMDKTWSAFKHSVNYFRSQL